MEHDQLFHALLLLGLLWLGMLLDWAWRQVRPTPCQTPPPPATPLKSRSKDPQPFPGLIHKPLCDAYVHGAEPRQPAPSAPPPRMVSTRGRRRQVDTSSHVCPTPHCSSQGWVGWGNLRANGHPGGGSGGNSSASGVEAISKRLMAHRCMARMSHRRCSCGRRALWLTVEASARWPECSMSIPIPC